MRHRPRPSLRRLIVIVLILIVGALVATITSNDARAHPTKWRWTQEYAQLKLSTGFANATFGRGYWHFGCVGIGPMRRMAGWPARGPRGKTAGFKGLSSSYTVWGFKHFRCIMDSPRESVLGQEDLRLPCSGCRRLLVFDLHVRGREAFSVTPVIADIWGLQALFRFNS